MNGTQAPTSTCNSCGRILAPGALCPNCAYLYSSPAPNNNARWLALAGCVVLLSALIWAVTPRGGASSPSASPSSVAQAPVLSAPPVQTAPPVTILSAPPTRLANPAPDTPTADATFWRKKAERDLRDAQTWTPTPEERAFFEALKLQDHLGVSNEARASDYLMRRPELRGKR